jgi:YfiH family protein
MNQKQDHMIRCETDGIWWFKYRHFDEFPELWQGIFTRHCGYSTGPYTSLNISHGLGDEASAVHRNRQVIARCVVKGDIVYIRQNHGTEILVFRKDAEFGQQTVGDAMITNIPNRFLAVQVADCQSVFLYDPSQQLVANVHAGWRGSVKNIIGHTLAAMKKTFGSCPEHIHAGVGPSLGPCCAEYRNYRREIPEQFWKYKDGDHRFDFWSLTSDQLTSAGVLAKHISISGICTKCRTDLFFSYRGEGVTGRFAAVIGLTLQSDDRRELKANKSSKLKEAQSSKPKG